MNLPDRLKTAGKVAAGLLLIALVVGDPVSSYFRRSKAQDAEAKASNAALEALRVSVRRTGAVTGWAAELAGKSATRLSPVMTSELQRIWLAGRPILFVGQLLDIARMVDGSYKVTLRHTDDGNGEVVFLGSDHLLTADCSPEQVAELQAMARDPDRYSSEHIADAALIAVVEDIGWAIVDAPESNKRVRLTGSAACIEVLSMPSGLPRGWASRIEQ